MKLHTDIISLLGKIANTLADDGHAVEAAAIYSLANNLRLLMRHDVTVYEWNQIYTGADRAPFDIDRLLP